MKLTAILPLAAYTLSASLAMAQATAAKPENGSQAEKKVSDLRITPVPKLPNVLLIGDSISIGYHLPARKMLAGKANVFRPVNPKTGQADNCADTSKGIASLDD